MKAKLIMNPNPMTLRPTDTVATAAERILKHHLRHLPVIDEQGRYLGTFSVYSLLKLTLPKAVLDEHGLDNVSFVTESLDDLAQRLGGRRDEPVKNWLNVHEVAHPDTLAMKIMLLMLEGRTTSVPVVDKTDGRLEGIISFWDVLEKLIGENK
ncbi:MAG TPA: CBS domain-containing protein [Candidatus Competibacter sp.]|jgi:CBS domain-containing protein|nr:CBS domain-containing protein [Candidatus Competibacter sp.]HRX61599.1 CBS domain-containing protein [Candidatus Competibacter sp.]HUM91998.1 CBS domain-containing protein [Candidatus Competibacter sp.]